MSNAKITLRAIVSLCIALAGHQSAQAHAPVVTPLPVHHIVSTLPYHAALAAKLFPVSAHSANALTTSFLLKQSLTKAKFATISSRVILPGGPSLSGANGALYSQLKSLATRSIYTSATTIGPISSGQTLSTVFTGYGPTLTPQPAEIDEFGRGNLLNNGGGTTFTFNNANVFSFAPVKTQVTGKVLTTGIIPVRTGSQATQAYQKLFSSVAAKGAQDGVYLQSHPIGGVLEGTYYYPSTFYPVYYQILAFGNSPLNNPALTSATYQQFGSFLQLAHNIRLNITNGQFLSTYYFRGTGNQFVGQAYNFDVFGKNALNVGSAGPTLGASYPFSVPYYLY